MLTNGSQPAPSPPVHAAKLSALLKSLASAESAVVECIKARKALIEQLESLLKTNLETVASEESQQQTLATRKTEVEAKKRDVEDSIMRGLSAEDAANGDVLGANDERPEIEALTPPTIESFTPPEEPPEHTLDAPITDSVQAADEFLQSLPMPQEPPATTPVPSKGVTHHPKPFANGSPSNVPGALGLSTAKRRKMSHSVHDGEFPEFGTGEDAMEGLDDDVKGMLES